MPNLCKRFRRLVLSDPDIDWDPADSAFVAGHRSVCSACAHYEREVTVSRAALTPGALPDTPEDAFTQKIAERMTQAKLKRQLSVWRPALIGGVAAAIVVAAVLQILTVEPAATTPTLQRTEATPSTPGGNRLFDSGSMAGPTPGVSDS